MPRVCARLVKTKHDSICMYIYIYHRVQELCFSMDCSKGHSDGTPNAKSYNRCVSISGSKVHDRP